MDEKLDYWSTIDDLGIMLLLSYLTMLTGCLFAPIFVPMALPSRSRLKKIAQNRRITMERTNSFLMSRVEYVGGHPLIPHRGNCILGLSPTHLTIYSMEDKKGWMKQGQYWIAPMTEIPIQDIVQTGTGRPKTAREIYDEDYGYTLDVYEGSPFLNIAIKLGEKTHLMSFQSFENWTIYHERESSSREEKMLTYWGLGDYKFLSPQDWHNIIVSLKYQLSESG